MSEHCIRDFFTAYHQGKGFQKCICGDREQDIEICWLLTGSSALKLEDKVFGDLNNFLQTDFAPFIPTNSPHKKQPNCLELFAAFDFLKSFASGKQ